MLQGCRSFTKLEFSLPVSFTKNYRSSRDDAKRTLENLLKITLKRVLTFSQIQFCKQAKWYFQTICHSINMTFDNSWQHSFFRLEILIHFMGGDFLLCHAFFCGHLSFLFFLFFSGIGILLRRLNGRRGGQVGVNFILRGKRHQYFLQVEYCNMHCSQKILCSVVRAWYSLLNGQGKSPIPFSRGWIHTFYSYFLLKKKKVAQTCWIMDALINFNSTISAV